MLPLRAVSHLGMRLLLSGLSIMQVSVACNLNQATSAVSDHARERVSTSAQFASQLAKIVTHCRYFRTFSEVP